MRTPAAAAYFNNNTIRLILKECSLEDMPLQPGQPEPRQASASAPDTY